MEIYYYRRVIFIISKLQLQFKFVIDHSLNSELNACRSEFCLEIYFLHFYHTLHLQWC